LNGLEKVCEGVGKLFVSLRLVQVNNEVNLNYNNGKNEEIVVVFIKTFLSIYFK